MQEKHWDWVDVGGIMVNVKRKAISDMLRTVIHIAIAILILLVLMPIASAATEKVASGGCTMIYQVMSALNGLLRKEPVPNFC